MYISRMMTVVILLTLIIPFTCLAYDWSEYGPSGIETYNFYIFGGGIANEIICEENGILINQNDVWTEYSYGNLPVWDVETVMAATADLIAIMGNGTDSDGIYGFNFSNYEFNVLYWLMNPRFVNYCPADSNYYAGGEDGLATSHDGLNWQNVAFFDGMYCHDMEIYQEHYVVSTGGNVYYSPDAGSSWFESYTMQFITDLEVSATGMFYGIFPAESWSSGFYSSSDYGVNWDVEIWTTNLSSASFDQEGNLFVGWEIPQMTHQGIACWQTDIMEFDFMNEGLPCFQINQITVHPLLDCIHILACTDDGMYLLTNYYTENSPDNIPDPDLQSRNFPNPFNPNTTIAFQLPTAGIIDLKIYNTRGQLINNLYHGFLPSGNNSINWNGKNNSNIELPSGIYYYRINTPQTTATGKMLMLK